VRVRGDKVIAMYIPHLPLSLWERVGLSSEVALLRRMEVRGGNIHHVQ